MVEERPGVAAFVHHGSGDDRELFRDARLEHSGRQVPEEGKAEGDGRRQCQRRRELSGGEAILDRCGLWRACDDRRRHDHDEPDVARGTERHDGAGTQEEDLEWRETAPSAQHEGRAERHAEHAPVRRPAEEKSVELGDQIERPGLRNVIQEWTVDPDVIGSRQRHDQRGE